MATINVFTEIFNMIDNVIVANLANGTAKLLTMFSPLLEACFIVYVMFVVYSYWQNASSIEGTAIDLMKRIIVWGVILSFGVNLSGYNNLVLPIVNDLGNGMAQAFSGYPSSNATVLDALAQQLLEVLNANIEAGKELPLRDVAGKLNVIYQNAILVICFTIFFIVAAAYIILAKVFLSILAVVGPLFIAMALFPATRGFATAWLNQVINYSLLFLFLSITAGIFIGFLQVIMQDMSAMEVISNAILSRCLVATGIFVIILLKLPELASGLAGGVAANGYGNLMSAVTSVTRLKGGGGAKGAKSGGGSMSAGKGATRAESKGR